jgi:hypothetical protein
MNRLQQITYDFLLWIMDRLLQGIGPRVLWIGVGGAIFFGVLEKTKQILAQRCPEPKM